MALRIFLDVFGAVVASTWWMIAVLLLLVVLIFRRQIASGWSGLTEKIIWWLSRIHIRRQLPEDLDGGGKQTIALGEGERLELVLIPPPASLWLQWQTVSNPKRKDSEGKPAIIGAPPLLLWVITLPLLAIAATAIIWFVVWFFSQGMEALPPKWLVVTATMVSLCLLIPIYWLYEWNRRHQRLVVTTLEAYVITFKAGTREFHRSPNPMPLIEEVILDSTWSDKPGLLGRVFGGWLHEFKDTGDAFMGTRVEEAGDFLSFFPHVSALGEIFVILNSEAKANKATKEVALRMAQEATLKGFADEAISGVAIAGGRGALAEARRRADAILNAWRAENPSGKEVNLVDPRILGFTLWNLETGERLEETES